MHSVGTIRRLWDALKLLHGASPRAFAMAIAATILFGSLPALLLYINAQLVGQLTTDAAAATVMLLVAVYMLLGGFHDGIGAISSFVVDTLQDRTRMAIRRNVNHAIATFPNLDVHEDADIRETAVLAVEASTEISDLVSRLYAVFMGATMLVPILAITGGIAWWVPVSMLFGMAPVIWFRARSERESWDVMETHGATLNELRILDRILTQPTFAKDLRVFRMQAGIMRRWADVYRIYLSAIRRVRIRNALRMLVVSVFASVCIAAPLYWVVRGFKAGQYSTAQLVFFLGAVFELKSGLAAIIYNFGDLLRGAYAMKPLQQLMAFHAAQPAREPAYGDLNGACVELRDIALTYREAGRPALDRVNLRLRRGEVVAVVGDNGAGKTTLLKVLAGLCAPTGGEILWSGADGDPSRLAAVFQDFARFPATIAANLASDDALKMRRCLEAVGLEGLSTRLDVSLTPELENGIDISGGQWQRLAIARAMVHADDATLLLFDEPTSALDPESEGEIMRKILDMSKGRAAVIVSHRLALTRFVDRIVVLDAGRIIEDGSHDALVAQDGKYARMFESQAAFYRDAGSRQPGHRFHCAG